MSFDEKNIDAKLVRIMKSPELTELSHSSQDFEKAIEAIPSRAACGPDGWTVPLVKGLKSPLSKLLALVFRKSQSKGAFSTILKSTYVMGIFKSGDKTIAANYPPIALTSHLSKILERVVRKEIVKYLTDNNLWDPR